MKRLALPIAKRHWPIVWVLRVLRTQFCKARPHARQCRKKYPRVKQTNRERFAKFMVSH